MSEDRDIPDSVEDYILLHPGVSQVDIMRDLHLTYYELQDALREIYPSTVRLIREGERERGRGR